MYTAGFWWGLGIGILSGIGLSVVAAIAAISWYDFKKSFDPFDDEED